MFSGAIQVVELGATASNSIVKSGGTEILYSGGTLSAANLAAGAIVAFANYYTSALPLNLPAGVIAAAGANTILAAWRSAALRWSCWPTA